MRVDLQQLAKQALNYALHEARRAANDSRLKGREMAEWERGHLQGQVLVAKYDLDADPIDAATAQNEIEFLAYRYGRE